MPKLVCRCGESVEVSEGTVVCPKCKTKYNVVKAGGGIYLFRVVA